MNLIYYGQALRKIKGHRKPQIAYVVSRDNDHIVKLSDTFPFVEGQSKAFFINAGKLTDFYKDAREGDQMNLFQEVKTIETLKKKHLK